MKIIYFFLLFISTMSIADAQQYNGVNVKSVKGYKYKGEKSFESYHQFDAGFILPRSMNFDGDGKWYNNAPDTSYIVNRPGIQVGYAFNWNRVAIYFRYMHEQISISTDHLVEEQQLHIKQNIFSLGFKYKWLYKDKLQMYSGASFGSALQRKYTTQNSKVIIQSVEGLGVFQIIALGINYKFSKFGIFGELGYGKMGTIYAGANFNI